MRLLFVAMISFVPSLVVAVPAYFNALMSEFGQAPLSRKCQTCHKNGPQLNPFGQDFYKYVMAGGGSLSNTDGWNALKAADSDADGLSNEEEITVDRHPGKVEAPPAP